MNSHNSLSFLETRLHVCVSAIGRLQMMCPRYKYFFILFLVCLFILFVFFTAKSLVASLMEVDQDQRLMAQEAIAHEW